MVYLQKRKRRRNKKERGIFHCNHRLVSYGLIWSSTIHYSWLNPKLYSDAFFETMSGFTTTGASILTDIEKLPEGLLFWRSLTQWLGGMGIIVLSIAILPMLGIGGMQLFIAEVPGPTKDKFHPRVRETAKRLWGIYVMLTMIEIILLFVGGMTLFGFYQSFFHHNGNRRFFY